jgi:hypothetical protein
LGCGWVDQMEPLKEPIGHRHPLCDEVVAAVHQKFELPGCVVVLGDRQIPFPLRCWGDRGCIDRV